MRRTLTELATSPDLVSGIYNYCDRWCERCQFTSRCLVYVTETDNEGESPESHDISNELFWRKLDFVLQDAQKMITAWAEETGIDLNDVYVDREAQPKKRHADAAEHRLAEAGKDYATAVTLWFSALPETTLRVKTEVEESGDLQDASEVIQWYQYQIPVKTMRALSSRSREGDPEESTPDELYEKDSDGSAKVALVGIDRSISAWRLMQLCLPEHAELVVPLILELEQLRQRIEKEFPNARDFIRPGFDEVLGEAN